MSKAWINIKTKDLPDFTVFGFHTGKTLDIKLDDGEIRENILYEGWGIFDKDRLIYPRVKFWREHKAEVTPLDKFCALANVETFDCGPDWGGRFGVRVKGSNFSICGFKTEKAAKEGFVHSECGVLGNAVLKLIRAKTKTKKVVKRRSVKNGGA